VPCRDPMMVAVLPWPVDFVPGVTSQRAESLRN
jgi:hypothetical protein